MLSARLRGVCPQEAEGCIKRPSRPPVRLAPQSACEAELLRLLRLVGGRRSRRCLLLRQRRLLPAVGRQRALGLRRGGILAATLPAGRMHGRGWRARACGPRSASPPCAGMKRRPWSGLLPATCQKLGGRRAAAQARITAPGRIDHGGLQPREQAARQAADVGVVVVKDALVAVLAEGVQRLGRRRVVRHGRRGEGGHADQPPAGHTVWVQPVCAARCSSRCPPPGRRRAPGRWTRRKTCCRTLA